MHADHFAARLKQLRTAASLTQQQLAERSGLGLGCVRDIEQGLKSPTWRSVLSLCRALDVNVEAFTQEPVVAVEAPRNGRSRRLVPPLKWHGGKQYLANRIVKLMPPHITYVEPFAGGLAVLLAKDPENVSEVVNDLDEGLTNFWRVLKEDDTFGRFHRRVEATPFSEWEWRDAGDNLHHHDSVRRAVSFFVRVRQSLAGRQSCFAPISTTRTRRGMNEQCSAWISAVDGLPDIHARLRRVAILERPAIEVIRQHDNEGTLFYIDPPYLAETRTAPDVYRHEMTVNQHRELLEVLKQCKGKVILSGYPHPLYDDTLKTWRIVDIEQSNHAAGGASKRMMTERLWFNYPPE